MKKVLLLAASSLLIAAALNGCSGRTVDTAATTTETSSESGTSASQTLDANTVADLIYSNVTFEDMMTKIDLPASIIKTYELPSDYDGDCAIYVSTGATPEELAVFEITDNCSSDDIINAAKARIAKQTDGYSSYAPEQVPKLNSAVVYSGSGYVVVCVSADNTAAAKFIKDYI